MATTTTDANGNLIYATDPNGNEISKGEKFFAGILLSAVTLFAVIAIVAHWPDQLPSTDTNAKTKYQYKWFAINYLGSNGTSTGTSAISTPANVFPQAKKDSVKTTGTQSDSVPPTPVTADSNKPTNNADTAQKQGQSSMKDYKGCTIDLNTLLLLLVALAGFLGNMIHISASFTNFVGAGKFKRSWLLWYSVKPFTAAALAVGVYIIFRAGFLNSADATKNVNLYGVVAIALLSGLFTDMATQKLKEVFGVIFQSSTVRPNPLELPPVKITSVHPVILEMNVETELVISGIGFENRTIKIKIDGQDIKDPDIQPNAITFKYTATAEKPMMVLSDEKGAEIAKYELKVAPATTAITVTGISPANLALNTPATISIVGTGLDTAGIVVKAGNDVIADADITKTATSISFSYKAATAGDLVVAVTDASGNALSSQTITVA